MKRAFLAFFFLLFVLSPSVLAQTYDRSELWQKEIDEFVDTDRRQTPPVNPALFVGSSSFRMWQSLREDFPQVSIVNRGFGGSHLEDVIHYADETILPYKPKTVVIYAGDNDITAGKSVERVFADYKTLCAIVHKSFPKTRILFISIKPSPSRREFWEKFQELNARIKTETLKDRRLGFVDVWKPMLTANGEPREELYLEDKLHMNPKGYAVWREVLGKYLN